MIRGFKAIFYKESKQISRDRGTLIFIFLIPIMQLLIFGYAINTTVSDIKTATLNLDRSQKSSELLWAFDNRKEILTDFINLKLTPNFNKLVYMNYNQATNFEKRSFHLNFIDKPFATVIMDRIDYSDFLNNILNHLYVVCPEGRAIDCHRNWETIYMRRIPIMEWNKYYEELYKDIPVLFIDNFENINKNFLEDDIDK